MREIKKVEVKDLWKEVERILGVVVAPYSLQANLEETIEVNGIELSFWGVDMSKAQMVIGNDLENPIEVFNSQGGVKWVWANLKRLNII